MCGCFLYEWKQTQKRLESAIREQKNICDTAKASGDNLLARQCNERIKLYQDKYKEISDIICIPKDTKQISVQKTQNVLTSGGKNSKIRTGGKINDKNLHKILEYEKQAKRYYQERMNDDADIIKISSNTRFTEEVKQIKNHMMSDDILFKNGEIRNFDPDIDQALAWKRLISGENIKETDYLLLEHELEEVKIMEAMEIPYENAHKLANQKFNWEDEIEKIIDEDELY